MEKVPMSRKAFNLVERMYIVTLMLSLFGAIMYATIDGALVTCIKLAVVGFVLFVLWHWTKAEIEIVDESPMIEHDYIENGEPRKFNTVIVKEKA